MTFTSTPIDIKDADGITQSMRAYSNGTSLSPAHASVDSEGNLVDPANATNQEDILAAINILQTAVANIGNIPSSPSTAGKQDTIITALGNILTALANVNNIPAAPATAANQSTGNTKLDSIITALANIANIPASPATAANQTSANTKLDTINTTLGGLATAANQATSSTALSAIQANTGAGSVSLTITPTITGATYTAGQVAGGKLTLANAARLPGGSGIINSVSVTKKTALTQPYDVYFFHTNPTNSTFTDNTALALSAADIPYLIGVVHCTDLVDNGAPKTLQALNAGLPFKLATGTDLYAVIVARGGETLGANALILNVGILQD